jgi:hypothetical protein
MPGFILSVSAAAQCQHLASARIGPSQTRVLLSGAPAATTAAQIAVTACPFQVPAPSGTKPQPCVRIVWGSVSSRVRASGSPLLLGVPGAVPGTCFSAEQIPQGAPTLVAVQTRVSAT